MQRRNLLFDTLFDCQIYIMGNAIMSATGTATFKISAGGGGGGGKLFLGRENSRATPPLYEALTVYEEDGALMEVSRQMHSRSSDGCFS